MTVEISVMTKVIYKGKCQSFAKRQYFVDKHLPLKAGETRIKDQGIRKSKQMNR